MAVDRRSVGLVNPARTGAARASKAATTQATGFMLVVCTVRGILYAVRVYPEQAMNANRKVQRQVKN